MPYQIKSMANTPYRPSNGTEGMMFRKAFCERCKFDVNQDCDILARTLFFQTDHAEYPKEWTHNDEGEPLCTAFTERN